MDALTVVTQYRFFGSQPAYVAGGFWRDKFFGTEPGDIDVFFFWDTEDTVGDLKSIYLHDSTGPLNKHIMFSTTYRTSPGWYQLSKDCAEHYEIDGWCSYRVEGIEGLNLIACTERRWGKGIEEVIKGFPLNITRIAKKMPILGKEDFIIPEVDRKWFERAQADPGRFRLGLFTSPPSLRYKRKMEEKCAAAGIEVMETTMSMYILRADEPLGKLA